MRNINLNWHFIAILISFPLGILNQNLGEMDFGSFNQFFGDEIIIFLKIVGFWNFLLCCKIFWAHKKSRALLITVLIYILILSLTRPAQRYLIFVIPFWAIMICFCFKIHRLIQSGFVLILCMLNIFATLYQVQNSRAARDIVTWSQKKDIKINSGIIFPHVGIFSHHDDNSKISVTMEPKRNEKIIYSSAVKIFDHHLREYFVVLPPDST